MKSLYISGTAGSGKTAIAAGLAQKFTQQGYRVSYLKPVGYSASPTQRQDRDALLMQKLLKMDVPLDVITPVMSGPSYLSGQARPTELLDKIKKAYEIVAEKADIVLIGGPPRPHMLGSVGLDTAKLAELFGAVVVYLIKIENDYSVDMAVFINNYLRKSGIEIIGNIFNHVSRPLLAKTEGIYRHLLEQQGYRTLGIIPRNPEVASPTVAEYLEVLGGELLGGEDRLDRTVEDLVIGAMTLESALGYLRRAPNKAVITGGDRSDICLAALETSTSVLILTGGLYPDVKVIARAEEKGVPVILVHYDTYTTLEKLSEVSRHLRPDDEKSLQLTLQSIEQHCQWQAILEKLL